MPITQTRVPVQFEDVFQAFDGKTRKAIDENLVGFGDALAGRGSALNDTIASLPSLLGHLQPVAAYLSDPEHPADAAAEQPRGVHGHGRAGGRVNARLFTDMATTFEAIGRDPNALEQTIAKSPQTEDVSIDSLKVQRPFLVDFNTLGKQLAPATASLKSSLPIINPAIEQGTQTLIRTPVAQHAVCRG